MASFDLGGLFGTIGGGIDLFNKIGGGGSSKTQKQAQKLNELIVEASLAPQVDARGNRWGFDRNTGQWFIELTDGTKRMLDSADAIQMGLLGAGAGEVAANPGGYNLADTQALYRRAAEDEINRQYKDTENYVANQALRSGTSAGPILDAMMKGRSRDAASAVLQAEKEALTDTENLNVTRQNRLLGLGSGVQTPTLDPARTAVGAAGAGRNFAALTTPQQTFGADLAGLGSSMQGIFKDLFPSGKPASSVNVGDVAKDWATGWF